MSTYTKTFVILGKSFNYKDMYDRIPDLYEKLESYMVSAHDKVNTEKDGLSCVYDGMCGKYIVIGKVLAMSDSSNCFDIPVCLYPQDYKYSTPPQEDIHTGKLHASIDKMLAGLGYLHDVIGLNIIIVTKFS